MKLNSPYGEIVIDTTPDETRVPNGTPLEKVRCLPGGKVLCKVKNQTTPFFAVPEHWIAA